MKMLSRFKIKRFVPKVGLSEAMIQDLLQELKYRMPNGLYKYTDKLEEGDLLKYRERVKVTVLTSKNIGIPTKQIHQIPIKQIPI